MEKMSFLINEQLRLMGPLSVQDPLHVSYDNEKIYEIETKAFFFDEKLLQNVEKEGFSLP